MKKKVVLWTGLWSLVVTTLAFGAATFAWINYHQPLSGTTIVSGDMAFSNLTTEVYRYDYPTFTGTTLTDYTAAGTVSKHVVSSTDYSFAMNKFDPTYILLAHNNSAVTQAYIGELYTNLVLKMSATLTYSTPVDYSLYLERNTSYAASVDVDGIQHYGISNYLNFVGLDSTTFAGLTTDKIADNDIVYYKTRNYALAATGTTFPTTSPYAINLLTTSITERPVGSTNVTVTVYLNVDFDATLTAPFFTAAKLGDDFILDMDYTLAWKAVEAS
jgi:hypothetical protein